MDQGMHYAVSDGTTPNERATLAAEAWGLAKRRGDDRLRAVALRDYREARREARQGAIVARLAYLDTLRTDYRLSARERELMLAMSDGRTFPSAAAALGISPRTARSEASAVYGRLGVQGLVGCYRALGWLRPA